MVYFTILLEEVYSIFYYIYIVYIIVYFTILLEEGEKYCFKRSRI